MLGTLAARRAKAQKVELTDDEKFIIQLQTQGKRENDKELKEITANSCISVHSELNLYSCHA